MRKIAHLLFFIATLSLLTQAQEKKRAGLSFDIDSYKVLARIAPSENRLEVVADVSITTLAETRTVIFELNGSLKVEEVTKVSDTTRASGPLPENLASNPSTPSATSTTRNPRATQSPTPSPTPQNKLNFIQDQVGVSEIGPNVRVDLGETLPANTQLKLRFKYAGSLLTPEGGPLLTKRLAFIGEKNGYLTYASRWLPFHEYAADRATADITISVPRGYRVVGYSDSPVNESQGQFRFVQTKPNFVGNFVYSNYFVFKKFAQNGLELQFYTKPGTENVVNEYLDIISKAFDFYAKQFGLPDCGASLVIAQTDSETLDYYAGYGILLLSDKILEQASQAAKERLPREVAYQWWGFTVALKSFDDAWISQGLAEFCAIEFREQGVSEEKKEEIRRELLEKALSFEQVASILRAPATLDDTSTAYQYIMFGKGAFVFKLLEETLGKEKFYQLLRRFLETYRGKNASIADFEKLTSEVAGQPMRYFFARWVESTGVPEFTVDYVILRTKDKKFITRGTVKQNYTSLKLPVDIQVIVEGSVEQPQQTVMIDDVSADFQIVSDNKPVKVVIDPKFKLLRISEDLKIAALVRRGLELFKEGNLAEAQKQFESALELDRSNKWIYYNLGLVYLEQRNYDVAIDNFKVITLGDRETTNPQWIYVWSFIKLGNAYDAKGDRTRAVDAYNKAIQIGDNYDNAQEVAKKFLSEPFDPTKNQ
jgi:tetratricopeptide (TPR) repeat protein